MDEDTYGAPQPRLFLPVVANGEDGYAVLAWFGLRQPTAIERSPSVSSDP